MRKELQDLRVDYFAIEREINKQLGIEEIISDENDKNKLLTNYKMIKDQGSQIDKLKSDGYQTAAIINGANLQ